MIVCCQWSVKSFKLISAPHTGTIKNCEDICLPNSDFQGAILKKNPEKIPLLIGKKIQNHQLVGLAVYSPQVDLQVNFWKNPFSWHDHGRYNSRVQGPGPFWFFDKFGIRYRSVHCLFSSALRSNFTESCSHDSKLSTTVNQILYPLS